MRRIAAEEETRKREAAALPQKFRQADEERKKADEERKRAQAERDRKLDERLNRIAGDGDNRWGRLMEALVEGDLLKLLRDADIEVARVLSQFDTEWREYDLVAVGESEAVVVEVKTTLGQSDVKRFTERMSDFREWRPDHARPQVRAALAYLTTDWEAARLAEAAGFYLIRAVGSSASIVNGEGFRPRFF